MFSGDLGLDREVVLGDVGGGDVVVPPGRDGGSVGVGCRGPGDSYRHYGLGQQAGLELTSYREVKTPSGGDPAAGLD